MTLAQVRPGLFGWPTFWFLYVAAGNLGAMAGALVIVVPLIALGDSPAQPVLRVVGTTLWIAAIVLAVLWAHPKIVRFIDRAHFRLTEDHLYLGRGDKVTVDLRDVTDVWFGTRASGGSATRSATRHGYRVLVLRLANGCFVPVSPPPGFFVGGESVDSPDMPVEAVVRGGSDLMTGLLTRLEPVLRDGDEMPWRMRDLTGPADVNWVYGPGAPQLPKGSRMPNWTFV
ncbi:hypothetical protein [Promicromonospora sp. NPDC023805]|uniref:hypothetical protein n=1 Tax=Promicromonospora sp. NPDC023805 TaxID=3154696 RepID=UPI0033D6F56D